MCYFLWWNVCLSYVPTYICISIHICIYISIWRETAAERACIFHQMCNLQIFSSIMFFLGIKDPIHLELFEWKCFWFITQNSFPHPVSRFLFYFLSSLTCRSVVHFKLIFVIFGMGVSPCCPDWSQTPVLRQDSPLSLLSAWITAALLQLTLT
jgi:hypothetical protein